MTCFCRFHRRGICVFDNSRVSESVPEMWGTTTAASIATDGIVCADWPPIIGRSATALTAAISGFASEKTRSAAAAVMPGANGEWALEGEVDLRNSRPGRRRMSSSDPASQSRPRRCTRDTGCRSYASDPKAASRRSNTPSLRKTVLKLPRLRAAPGTQSLSTIRPAELHLTSLAQRLKDHSPSRLSLIDLPQRCTPGRSLMDACR